MLGIINKLRKQACFCIKKQPRWDARSGLACPLHSPTPPLEGGCEEVVRSLWSDDHVNELEDLVVHHLLFDLVWSQVIAAAFFCCGFVWRVVP